MSEPLFAQGDMVNLLADPSRQGAVIQVHLGGEEFRYTLFIDNTQKSFYERQLRPIKSTPSTSQTSLKYLQARLTALLLNHPGREHLYAFNSGEIDYIPYQYRPVLKFIKADRPRLLIADEVGVGKTIEAALIMKELQARQQINSVLIICPRPLVAERKWELEMKRFGERFEPVDGPRLRHYLREAWLEGDWPLEASKLIIPYSLFKQDILEGNEAKGHPGLFSLDPPPKFDLLIVDEAHHLRNADSWQHQGVNWLCQKAEAVIFLTATPIQLGQQDLFTLLNLLRPDLIRDDASFQLLLEPNHSIHQAVQYVRLAQPNWQQQAKASLLQAVATNWGQTRLKPDPQFQNLLMSLDSQVMPDNERVRLVRHIEEYNSFSSLINRTRRRDIGQFTQREAVTIEAPFTPEQEAFYLRLLETRAQQLQRTHGKDVNQKFMLNMLMRQAASCLAGLATLSQDWLQGQYDQMSESLEELETEEIEKLQPLMQKMGELIGSSQQITGPDLKLDKLLEILKQKQALPNNKSMLFTTFRHTLAYLQHQLILRGFRVGVMHGGTPDEERRQIRERFKAPRQQDWAIDVLLSSEIGCEGLDYQFCDTLINYDLPWNPMRIEQRIGRIDRFGQKSPKVLIYNLIVPGTVDYDIYERCLMRLGIFQQALGGSEVVLGDIFQEIKAVAEAVELSEEQRQERLQQLADNQIRRLQEQQLLEEQEATLMGLKVPREQIEEEIEAAHNIWLSPAAFSNLISCYLSDQGEAIILRESRSSLRLNDRLRQLLLEGFDSMPKEFRMRQREWRERFKRKGESLVFEFQNDTETEKQEIISAAHPLVRIAANKLLNQEIATVYCRIETNEFTPGTYPFAIYLWHYTGPRQDAIVRFFSTQPEGNAKLIDLLIQAEDMPEVELPDAEILLLIESNQHAVWCQERIKHQQESLALSNLQRQSLKASFLARIEQVQQLLQRTSNDKIQRMRQHELDNLEHELQLKLDVLEELTRSAEVESVCLATGIFQVEVPL